MRAYLPGYELRAPASLDEALCLLEREPEAWAPFAGGTDLMVLLELGKLRPGKFLSLWNLRELQGIEQTAEFVTLGALTTYSEIQRNLILQREFPMLCQAARETGAVAIQNRGTLAGNIANASPAADSPPALLAYDGQVELISKGGKRWVPYREFHVGYRRTLMRSNELISRVRLSRLGKYSKQSYRKVGTRRAQAISKVCFAGVLQLEGMEIREARIAFGSVATIPLRCHKTESTLWGQPITARLLDFAKETLWHELSPIDDFRSTADYRRRVATNLLEEFLTHPQES